MRFLSVWCQRSILPWTCFGLVESSLVGAAFLELDGALEAERGMAPAGIVEAVAVAGQSLGRLSSRLEDGAPDQFALQRLEDVSTIALS